MRAHLQKCSTCGAYASQLGAICAQLGEPVTKTPVVEPPPGFHARLEPRVQSEQQAAFNRSYEEFDALLTQNARRNSTADGMTLMGAGATRFEVAHGAPSATCDCLSP